jgi:hypothetical protein
MGFNISLVLEKIWLVTVQEKENEISSSLLAAPYRFYGKIGLRFLPCSTVAAH